MFNILYFKLEEASQLREKYAFLDTKFLPFFELTSTFSHLNFIFISENMDDVYRSYQLKY